jgi:signal transduction histidine kinase
LEHRQFLAVGDPVAARNKLMKEKALQVLLVEDNEGDALLLRRMFRSERAGNFELTHLLRMSEAVVHLAKGGVDIALLDLGLPDAQGLETVRRAHAVAPDVPLIVLTGLDDEALAAEAMKEGAQDYLIKGQIENRALPRALRHAIERQRMQGETNQIRELQLRLKDDFLSHVSHELRSPITAIYQFVSILADGLAGELRPEQTEYLRITLRNVRQLESMIADLLEVTRIQGGKLNIELQAASLRDAITDTVSMFEGSAAAKGITLRANIPADLPPAYVDPSRVRQVLINLVSNAIKFTAKGGEIKLQTRIFEEDPCLLAVEIADTGCGIKPEVSKLIFERLYQANDAGEDGRKGLGLGLYISKELVARQGGKIWVTSEPQKGSSFYFTVPIFSLASLISPILTNELKTGDGIAVLVVEMGAQDGLLSPDVRIEMSNVARTLLQRCLLPDLDVILPKMGSGYTQELFFVVACANKQGAEVMSKRVREQFRRCEQLQEAGLTFTVSYSFLSPTSRSANEPIEEFAERVAAGVQEHINTKIEARSVST